MGQHGHRNMYYLTGLPGWMQFGYCPGWVGRSATGLGPAAQFMMTGQWPTPQMQAYWNAVQNGAAPNPVFGQPGFQPFAAPMTAEQEVQWLKKQAEMLSQQLEAIKSRISEFEKEK